MTDRKQRLDPRLKLGALAYLVLAAHLTVVVAVAGPAVSMLAGTMVVCTGALAVTVTLTGSFVTSKLDQLAARTDRDREA